MLSRVEHDFFFYYLEAQLTADKLTHEQCNKITDHINMTEKLINAVSPQNNKLYVWDILKVK